MTTHDQLTWADVKDRDDLQAIAIVVDSFGEVTTKEWIRHAMDPEHWSRIVSIAQTTPEELAARPAMGFSWVSAVVIGSGESEAAFALEPPAHLTALIEQH